MQEYVLWFTKSNLKMKTNCRKKISFQKKMTGNISAFSIC